MADDDIGTVHMHIYASVNNQDFAFLGHDDVPKVEGPEQAAAIATMLHQIAWQFEDYARDGTDTEDVPPRRIITPAGDEFYEVAPDQFVVASSFDDAVETHNKRHESASFKDVTRAYPRARWEYI
jgi:hypothetical protein